MEEKKVTQAICQEVFAEAMAKLCLAESMMMDCNPAGSESELEDLMADIADLSRLVTRVSYPA